jgi:hypothetical protein
LAVVLGLLTFFMATEGVITFLLTAGVLGGLGHRAVKRYREGVPWAASGHVDLALVGAGKALPAAAILAGWSGMIAGLGFGNGDRSGPLLTGFLTIGLAVWALVRRKRYYGLEAEQAACDARLASYNADVAWMNSLSFEPWYEHVLRQPAPPVGPAQVPQG